MSDSDSETDHREHRNRVIQDAEGFCDISSASEDEEEIDAYEARADGVEPEKKKVKRYPVRRHPRAAHASSPYGKRTKVQAANILNTLMLTSLASSMVQHQGELGVNSMDVEPVLANNIEGIPTPTNFIDAVLQDEQIQDNGQRWTGPTSAYSKEWLQWNALGVTSWPKTIPINKTDKNKPIIDLMSLHDMKYDEKGKLVAKKLRPVARGD